LKTIKTLSFPLISFEISFDFLLFFYLFSSFKFLFVYVGDYEDVKEASETAEAIAALKEKVYNLLALAKLN